MFLIGGMPFKICKLNVVNMNKQAKLFSQGMHPVVRIGDNGKWELTKDNPTYFVRITFDDHISIAFVLKMSYLSYYTQVENENFTLSFLHKPGDNIDVKYYYAFTFPFTYTDCQLQLDYFDAQYHKTTTEFKYIIDRLLDDCNKRKDIQNNDIQLNENNGKL